MQRSALQQADQFVKIMVVGTDGGIAAAIVDLNVAGIFIKGDVIVETLLTQPLQIQLVAMLHDITGRFTGVCVGGGGSEILHTREPCGTGGG